MNKLKMEMELDIPEWGKWLVQDKDGSWHVFDINPRETIWRMPTKYDYVGRTAPTPDWEDEVYELVWEWY